MPVTVDNTYHALSIEIGVRNRMFSGATCTWCFEDAFGVQVVS